MKFRLPHLPFGHAELEPFLSSEQVDTHYFGHHKNYVEKVNQLVIEQGLPDATLEYIINNQDGKLFDNGAQAWNHTFYWMGLTPLTPGPNANGKLMEAINRKYGNLEGLKERFIESAAALFGSGWCWLVATPDGEIDIVNTQNADNPIRLERVRPLWTCDVWEHAYYVDYRNERKEYLRSAWRHVNWEFIERNYSTEEVPNMTRLMTDPSPTAPHKNA
ncbi:MAG: superoxide dismutase [Bdellovibrionales bacterium]|nr:superoxide dismutase [Bdellovibrionales bacterium]